MDGCEGVLAEGVSQQVLLVAMLLAVECDPQKFMLILANLTEGSVDTYLKGWTDEAKGPACIELVMIPLTI